MQAIVVAIGSSSTEVKVDPITPVKKSVKGNAFIIFVTSAYWKRKDFLDSQLVQVLVPIIKP